MKMRDARFEVYKDAKNEWRWRLISSNGNIIASSAGDGYKNKQDCIDGLKATNPNAPFNIVDTITNMGEHGGKRGRKKNVKNI